jgi:signal peptidase II
MLGTAAAVAAFDHVTKWLIASHLAPGQQIWPNAIVSIDHVENTGAAFSVLPQLHWLYLAVALIVSLYIVFFGYRYGTTWYRQVLIGMILGGALSNGVDRLIQGSVVDFIDVHWWPVFNVADSCIVVAIVVLLVLSFLPAAKSS